MISTSVIKIPWTKIILWGVLTYLIVLIIVDYVLMIGLCFFILPFTYFYAEEALESEDDLELDFESDEEDDISTS